MISIVSAQPSIKILDAEYVDLFHDYSVNENGDVVKAVSYPLFMDAYYLYLTVSVNKEFIYQYGDFNFEKKSEYQYGSFDNKDTTNSYTDFYIYFGRKKDIVRLHCCRKTVIENGETILRLYSSIPEGLLPFNGHFSEKDYGKGLPRFKKKLLNKLQLLYYFSQTSQYTYVKISNVTFWIDGNSSKYEFQMNFCK